MVQDLAATIWGLSYFCSVFVRDRNDQMSISLFFTVMIIGKVVY